MVGLIEFETARIIVRERGGGGISYVYPLSLPEVSRNSKRTYVRTCFLFSVEYYCLTHACKCRRRHEDVGDIPNNFSHFLNTAGEIICKRRIVSKIKNYETLSMIKAFSK